MDKYDDLLIKARSEMLGKKQLRKEPSSDFIFNYVWDNLQKGGILDALKGGFKNTRNEQTQPLTPTRGNLYPNLKRLQDSKLNFKDSRLAQFMRQRRYGEPPPAQPAQSAPAQPAADLHNPTSEGKKTAEATIERILGDMERTTVSNDVTGAPPTITNNEHNVGDNMNIETALGLMGDVAETQGGLSFNNGKLLPTHQPVGAKAAQNVLNRIGFKNKSPAEGVLNGTNGDTKTEAVKRSQRRKAATTPNGLNKTSWSVAQNPFANPFDNPQPFAIRDNFGMQKNDDDIPKEFMNARPSHMSDEEWEQEKRKREMPLSGSFTPQGKEQKTTNRGGFKGDFQDKLASADTSLLPQGMLKQFMDEPQQQPNVDFSLLPQGWREEVVE